MKLQMKNQLAFQEQSGYPEDPEPMTEDEVRTQLMYWHDEIVKLDEMRDYNPDLANLEAFLYNLARGEVEYTEPAREYKFIAGYEYCKEMKVFAYSQEEADKKARAEFEYIAANAPLIIGRPGSLDTARFGFKYLERNEDHDFCRIVECVV